MDLFTEALQFLQEKYITQRTFSLEDAAHLMAGFTKSKLEEKSTSIPPAEGAEEILQKYMDMSMIICPLHVVPRTVALDAMHEFAAQQQPTAEGAEEYLHSTPMGYIYRTNKGRGFEYKFDIGNVISLMDTFAALRAQRIADKMVEERLRKELIAYDKWLYYKWIEGDVTTTEEHINEYLKSREK